MDRQTIDSYNKRARTYDEETADFWRDFSPVFLDKFAARAGTTTLNVGSGPGRDALLLKERGLDVTCLDASEAMIALSEERGLRAVLGDFSALPFSDNSFDSVWAYTSLLHIPKNEVDVALSEIRRVLNESGVFGLGLIEGENETYKLSSGIDLPRWFSFYTEHEARALLLKNGFTLLHFESHKPKSKTYLNFIAQKTTP